MDESPEGNEICVVTGNAQGIINRGSEIQSLGEQMEGAAAVLRVIASTGVADKGLSIEKIKEVIGEIDEELRLAGTRYTPTGKALGVYGAALASVQDDMALIVPRCQEAWDSYLTVRQTSRDLGFNAPSPTSFSLQSDDARADALQTYNAAVTLAGTNTETAHDAFLTEARSYDTTYSTWETAFNTATESIGTATTGGIEDSRWDDLDGVVAGVLVVLQWAGVALAIAAFVIGGPIIIAIGAIVAIAALALTIYKSARGDATKVELALAIVGVIPFGSLAKFAGGFRPGALGFLDEMVGGLGSVTGRSNVIGATMSSPRLFKEVMAGPKPWHNLATVVGGSSTLPNVAARLMGFGFADDAARAMGSGWGAAGTVFGHYGWVATSPVSTGLFVNDLVRENFGSRPVETWSRQLA